MNKRSKSVSVGLLVITLLSFGIFLQSEKQGEKGVSNDEINIMVDKALDAMKGEQRSDGAIGNSYEVATTSICGLAFLAAGYQAGKGRYGIVVTKAIKYLLNRGRKRKSGYICEDNCTSRMHGQGFALTFLSYAIGDACTSKQMEDIGCDTYKNVMRKAIRLAEESQSRNGGWIYDPYGGGDENSVTVCIVMGLRAAKEAGFRVKEKVIKKGGKYIEDCANPDGSFSYSLGSRGGTVTLTGAGISDLYFYGRHSQFSAKHKQLIDRGIKFIWDNKSQLTNLSFGMYSLFYSTLAMYWAGDKYWDQWFKFVVDIIKNHRKDDGTIGHHYGILDSGFATLILLIPKKILPLFDK